MTGLSKPSEYFQNTILPALRDHTNNPLDERYANIAAKAVSDQIEWVYCYYSATDKSRLEGATSLSNFRTMLFVRCPELRLMWDTGDASKHRFLTRPSATYRTVASSTDAYMRSDTGLLLAGREFRLVLIAAVEFWRNWVD